MHLSLSGTFSAQKQDEYKEKYEYLMGESRIFSSKKIESTCNFVWGKENMFECNPFACSLYKLLEIYKYKSPYYCNDKHEKYFQHVKYSVDDTTMTDSIYKQSINDHNYPLYSSNKDEFKMIAQINVLATISIRTKDGKENKLNTVDITHKEFEELKRHFKAIQISENSISDEHKAMINKRFTSWLVTLAKNTKKIKNNSDNENRKEDATDAVTTNKNDIEQVSIPRLKSKLKINSAQWFCIYEHFRKEYSHYSDKFKVKTTNGIADETELTSNHNMIMQEACYIPPYGTSENEMRAFVVGKMIQTELTAQKIYFDNLYIGNFEPFGNDINDEGNVIEYNAVHSDDLPIVLMGLITNDVKCKQSASDIVRAIFMSQFKNNNSELNDLMEIMPITCKMILDGNYNVYLYNLREKQEMEVLMEVQNDVQSVQKDVNSLIDDMEKLVKIGEKLDHILKQVRKLDVVLNQCICDVVQEQSSQQSQEIYDLAKSKVLLIENSPIKMAESFNKRISRLEAWNQTIVSI